MNLGKLLGAGKSFFGGGAIKSYRTDKRCYLPKFNAEKNPFLPKPVEPAPAAPAPEAKKVSAPVVPRFGGATAVKAPEMPCTPTARPTRSTSWTDKLNPFRNAKPVAPPMTSAVQVELSLDAVKPIANDLADADIEVVPVKSRTVPQPEPTLLPASREAWEFAGVRMAKTV